MGFRQTHSTIPDDIIYHIEADGRTYVGQSIDGFTRIQRHCTDSFRCKMTGGDGSEKMYEAMRAKGLYQTDISFYVAPNYGLDETEFIWFFSQYVPSRAGRQAAKWSYKDATPQDRRDAAEVMHILHEKLTNPRELTNESMGGQVGSFKYRGDNSDDPIKLLTRTMSPEEALKLMNTSDTSKRNLITVFNQINDTLFTDKWKTLYNKRVLDQIDKSLFNKPEKQDFITLTWGEFIDQELLPYLLDYVIKVAKHEYSWNPSGDFLASLTAFANGKELYIKQLLTDADNNGIELTQAERNLISKTGVHVFSAHIDFSPLTDYLNEFIRNEMIKLGKKGNLNKDTAASKAKSFTKVIRVSALFNIQSLHMAGTTSDHLSAITYKEKKTVDKLVKVGFSITNFQFMNKSSSISIFSDIPQRYIEFGVDGDPNAIAVHSKPMAATTEDKLGYWMSSKNVEARRTELVRECFLNYENTWVLDKNVWSTYFGDMMHFWRQYNRPNDRLDWYMVSNRQGDLYLTQESDKLGIRIYFTDVYKDTEVAQSLSEVEYY